MTAVEHNMIFITAQKIRGTLQCTVASSTLRCTVVGPPSAKQNKITTAGFEHRTFYLGACILARCPNNPSHPKARTQEEPRLSNNIKSNVQWSTAQWRNGSRVGDETYWTQHEKSQIMTASFIRDHQIQRWVGPTIISQSDCSAHISDGTRCLSNPLGPKLV